MDMVTMLSDPRRVAMQWINCSLRPLSLCEMAQKIEIDFDNEIVSVFKRRLLERHQVIPKFYESLVYLNKDTNVTRMAQASGPNSLLGRAVIRGRHFSSPACAYKK